MKKKILIVGGAGYIGSHMVQHLLVAGEQVTILDNLSNGHRDAVLGGEFVPGDIADSELLHRIFSNNEFDTVMHFASFIQVGESVTHPGKYFQNNLANTINLLNAMAHHNIPYFIFSSTAAIFGEPRYAPIDEEHPQAPMNPYGRSKWMVEQLLPDYERAHGIRSVCLRYFNAAGADPDGKLGERHDPETHLIPLAIRAALGKVPSFKLFGDDYQTLDGTCIRDFIHVSDLCHAHRLALAYLRQGGVSDSFNLGNGAGYSVRQVLDTVIRLSGRPIKVEISRRRDGDPARLVADAKKIKRTLGWNPEFEELETIVAHSLRWECGLA